MTSVKETPVLFVVLFSRLDSLGGWIEAVFGGCVLLSLMDTSAHCLHSSWTFYLLVLDSSLMDCSLQIFHEVNFGTNFKMYRNRFCTYSCHSIYIQNQIHMYCMIHALQNHFVNIQSCNQFSSFFVVIFFFPKKKNVGKVRHLKAFSHARE